MNIRYLGSAELFWNKIHSEDKILLSNSFWNMSGTVLSRMIMLFTSIMIARYIGANLFGQWGVINSTASMFTTFLSFGFGVTAMKHIAEYKGIDPTKASRVFSISLVTAIIFGLFLSLYHFRLTT